MVFQIPRDRSHLLYLPTYVRKILTYTNFRRVVMATKIKPRKNLTGVKFYQRKFPNLRYILYCSRPCTKVQSTTCAYINWHSPIKQETTLHICKIFLTRVSAISSTPVSPTPISPTYYHSVPFRLLK